MPSPRPIDGPDIAGIMYSACPFSCACVCARVRTGGYILQPDCRRLPVSFYFVQFLARSNEFWLDLVSIKVCIHFSTRCTTGWSKRLEYSFDQTRRVVYCPQGGYIFYAGASLAGAGYCRQCRRRPAILPLQLRQGCQVSVKISAQRLPRVAQFYAC